MSGSYPTSMQFLKPKDKLVELSRGCAKSIRRRTEEVVEQLLADRISAAVYRGRTWVRVSETEFFCALEGDGLPRPDALHPCFIKAASVRPELTYGICVPSKEHYLIRWDDCGLDLEEYRDLALEISEFLGSGEVASNV